MPGSGAGGFGSLAAWAGAGLSRARGVASTQPLMPGRRPGPQLFFDFPWPSAASLGSRQAHKTRQLQTREIGIMQRSTRGHAVSLGRRHPEGGLCVSGPWRFELGQPAAMLVETKITRFDGLLEGSDARRHLTLQLSKLFALAHQLLLDGVEAL